MARIPKFSVFCLIIILLVSSMLLIMPSNAQTITKPSVPEFTLKPTANTFIIPPYSTINPYTGENQTLSPGYSGTSRGVEITVQNQPFTPYTDIGGNLINVYYNVSLKGSFGNVWGHYPDATYEDLFNASTSTYTVIEVSMEPYPSIPDGGSLDFRLQALIGHYNYDTTPSGVKYVTGFTALETSDWSKPQTVTLTKIYSSSPSPSPTVPEFPLLAVFSLFVVIPLMAIIVKKRICLKAYN
jgi:hypothetical protein